MRLVIALLAAALVGCERPPPPLQPSTQAAGQAHVAVPHHRACAPAGFPTKWDRQIAQAERRYLPASWLRLAPCGWRAQLAAESGLNDAWCHRPNPHGTSASCLAQLTRAAAVDARKRGGLTGSRSNPQASIRMGAWYLASMRRVWSEPRSTDCRRTLAVASYHAGAGTLLTAQVAARATGRTARCYGDGIGEHLERHGPQNRAYVARVHTLQVRMSR